MLAGLIAFAMSVGAAALVFYSWRQNKAAWASATGWLLALASAFVWSSALGPEFGVSYAIMIFVCLVWAEVILTMQTGKTAVDPAGRPFRKLHWPGIQSCFKHSMLFLLSVPATGVIAMMLSVALVLYLPWTMPVKLAVAISVYPVLWGALSAWVCAQVKLLRATLASLALLAISSLLLYI